MATPLTSTLVTQRRIVLVDFDWEDADLIPELLSRPNLSVRLVAGSTREDAGVRLAELCGLPRTIDLADLTREIFDLALVSEKSPRRTQIEGLLLALGTPSLSPQSFVMDAGSAERADTTPAVEAPLALHAAVLETTLGGSPFDALVEQALPDISDDSPTTPPPVVARGEPRFVIPSLEDFPSPEGRLSLETALRALMSDTGAGRAELFLEGPRMGELSLEVGPEDALLKGLVDRARSEGTPQVVASVTGPAPGVAWGAWPFRTGRHRGVLAAAGITPAQGWSRWQELVDDLRGTWDREEKEREGPAFPLLPEPASEWLDPEAFLGRLELASERNRRDGLRFTLHRLEFPISAAALDLLSNDLLARLRDTDSVCRPAPNRLLLLIAGPQRSSSLRARIQSLWSKSWLEAGHERPIPGIVEERIELKDASDHDAFVARASDWLEAE